MKLVTALFFSLLAVVAGRQNTSLESHSLSVAAAKAVTFLRHGKDACECTYDDACSCESALDFMRCMRGKCDSDACKCTEDGDNHFQRACQKMADGCPKLGMECGAETATCGSDTVTWQSEKSEKTQVSYSTKGTKDAQEEEEDDEGEEKASLDEEDLPPGWEAMYSKEYEKVYYGNTETGEVTWTKPKKQPSKAAVKKQSDSVPKKEYKKRVGELHRKEHNNFAKGTVTTILVLCLALALCRSSDSLVKKNTWLAIDAVITVFLSLMWFYVVMHYLDFAKFTGLESLAAHLTIATALLLISSLISWIMHMQEAKDKNAELSESCDIFNSLFDPIVMWCNAGAVSTAQQLAKPSEFNVLLMTGAMVGFYAFLAVFWYNTVGLVTRRNWSEATITKLTGAALAAGTVLWVHMILVGSYQTIQDPHPSAPGFTKTLILQCFGLLYIVLECVVTKPLSKLIANTDKNQNYLKWRALEVISVFVTFLKKYSCVTSLGHLIIDNCGYKSGAIEARLLLALVSTFIGVFLIYLCAKVKALSTDKVLSGIFVDLGGFMMGAAWSGLLNNSISNMSAGYRHPFVVTLEVNCFLTACIIPTYFFYLKPLIDSQVK
jgi:hypothetical protein